MKNLITIKNNKKLLQNKYFKINKKYILINGIIVSGFGSGKRYLHIKEYNLNIRKILNKHNLYPGTLNILINKQYNYLIENRNIFKNCSYKSVEQFHFNNNNYGKIDCYKCKIKNIESLIIIPEKTTHNHNILEIATYINLKKKFKSLEKKNKINLKLFYSF